MIPAHSLDDVLKKLAESFSTRYKDSKKTAEAVRMVGLLFAPPGSQITKSELLPRLNDFHHRSGNNIDFFCAGYGAFWPDGWIEDSQTVVTITEPPFGHKKNWLYSSKLFNDFRKEVESASNDKWRYSEGVVLILLNAHADTKEYARLDFSKSIVLNLDALKHDNLIRSAEQLFGLIFQYVEKHDGDDPTWGFSDSMGFREGKSWLYAFILSLLPAKAGKLLKVGRHYAVNNLS